MKRNEPFVDTTKFNQGRQAWTVLFAHPTGLGIAIAYGQRPDGRWSVRFSLGPLSIVGGLSYEKPDEARAVALPIVEAFQAFLTRGSG